MAKNILSGNMRTRINFQTLTTSVDTDGFPIKVYTTVFTKPVYCKWVWEHGNEAMENARLKLEETAVVTMYYTDDVDIRARVVRVDDSSVWEIVRINVIEDMRSLMELYVRRVVKS